MSEGIQFEDDQDAKFLYSRIEKSRQAPKVVRFMVDRGWVRDEKTAMYVMLGVAIAAAIIAITFPMIFGGEDTDDGYVPEEDPALLSP